MNVLDQLRNLFSLLSPLMFLDLRQNVLVLKLSKDVWSVFEELISKLLFCVLDVVIRNYAVVQLIKLAIRLSLV